MALARNVLLAAAGNRWLREHATRAPFVRRSVSRFMPGERLADALAATAALQERGIGTMLTRLGENVTRVEEAEEVTAHYLDVLDHVKASGFDAHVSVKPTQLGLDLDGELCARLLQQLVERAATRDSFVWIDMESSPYVDRTLNLFRRVSERSALVGVAIQAYLFRSEDDIRRLLPLGASIRLVKGAYLEPAAVAYPSKTDVDRRYYALACLLLSPEAQTAGTRLQIATHDRRLLDQLGTFIQTERVPHTRYEYAMLYGIERSLQQQLADAGHKVRVLLSYGEHWFQWYMRRLAERPANVWFVAKSMFAR